MARIIDEPYLNISHNLWTRSSLSSRCLPWLLEPRWKGGFSHNMRTTARRIPGSGSWVNKSNRNSKSGHLPSKRVKSTNASNAESRTSGRKMKKILQTNRADVIAAQSLSVAISDDHEWNIEYSTYPKWVDYRWSRLIDKCKQIVIWFDITYVRMREIAAQEMLKLNSRMRRYELVTNSGVRSR